MITMANVFEDVRERAEEIKKREKAASELGVDTPNQALVEIANKYEGIKRVIRVDPSGAFRTDDDFFGIEAEEEIELNDQKLVDILYNLREINENIELQKRDSRAGDFLIGANKFGFDIPAAKREKIGIEDRKKALNYLAKEVYGLPEESYE